MPDDVAHPTETSDEVGSHGLPSIAFVVIYMGKWPPWFPAYLQSCRYNPSIDWIFYTDIEPPPNPPSNVRFLSTTSEDLKALVRDRLGHEVNLQNYYKLCDLKPACGLMFEDDLVGYDFWGMCDIDVIWGDIRAFVTPELLNSYDILTTRKRLIAGHFCLFRNDPSINALFLQHADIVPALAESYMVSFSEVGMGALLREKEAEGLVTVFWPEFLLNFARPVDEAPGRLSPLDSYSWDHGRIFCRSDDGSEIMYLHFLNWKDSLKVCSFGYEDDPGRFTAAFDSVMEPGKRLSGIIRAWNFFTSLRRPADYVLWLRRIFRRRKMSPIKPGTWADLKGP